jgi:hypothetical protein
MNNDLPHIHEAVTAGRVRWRYHALIRARQRGIERASATRVPLEGDLVEEYPGAAPFPKYLFVGATNRGRLLYVAVSYDRLTGYVTVIASHWLDPRREGEMNG